MNKTERDTFALSITESPSAFNDLEKMSVHTIVASMNEEDKKVPLAVAEAMPRIETFIELVLQRMQQGGRMFYLGAGTSGRLGVLDASELPPTFGVEPGIVIGLIAGGDAALRKAVEAAEDDPERAWHELLEYDINPLDTVLGIAASGTTPYVVGGVKIARQHGILTGCITCNPGSKVAQVAEYPIEVVVGPEFVTGSTRLKAGTAQKMVLNIITTTLMIKMGRVKGNKMINMQLTNQKLVKRGTRMLMEELGLPANEALEVLVKYGSVKRALDALNPGRGQS